jgi:hypothetical protein
LRDESTKTNVPGRTIREIVSATASLSGAGGPSTFHNSCDDPCDG